MCGKENEGVSATMPYTGGAREVYIHLVWRVWREKGMGFRKGTIYILKNAEIKVMHEANDR